MFLQKVTWSITKKLQFITKKIIIKRLQFAHVQMFQISSIGRANLVKNFQFVLNIWTKCRLNFHEVKYFHEVEYFHEVNCTESNFTTLC